MQSRLSSVNENHCFIVAEQLRDIGIQHDPIIFEPVGRNTAPEIALATLKLIEMISFYWCWRLTIFLMTLTHFTGPLMMPSPTPKIEDWLRLALCLLRLRPVTTISTGARRYNSLVFRRQHSWKGQIWILHSVRDFVNFAWGHLDKKICWVGGGMDEKGFDQEQEN